jgi:hypothetical protein
MGGTGPQLAQRLRKYTSGTFAGIFSQQSNIDINNPMVVFNIRDLEDELRPVAMYIVLNYIWNKTKVRPEARMLIVDEAWQLMKYEDSPTSCLASPSGPVNTTWASPPSPRTSKTLWARAWAGPSWPTPVCSSCSSSRRVGRRCAEPTSLS